ncbi:hypothetical protein JG688_00000213, partial [Phytophthora aleatoria]
KSRVYRLCCFKNAIDELHVVSCCSPSCRHSTAHARDNNARNPPRRLRSIYEVRSVKGDISG